MESRLQAEEPAKAGTPTGADRKTGQLTDFSIGTFFNSVTYEGSGYQVLSSNTIALGSLSATNTTGTNTFASGIILAKRTSPRVRR